MFIVSSILFDDGEIFPTINVYVFPVKDYWSNLVSFDSRNAATIFVFEDNEAITLPNVVSDWLIFFSYWKCSVPIVSPLFIFYEPAKSHKFNLAFYMIKDITLNIPLLSGWTDSNKIWKIVCDLLLFVFIEVCLIKRFFSPRFINYKQSR